MKNKKIFSLIGLATFLVVLSLTGASCTGGQADGGVFVSTSEAEDWQQITFVREEKRKTINISAVSVRTIVFDPQENETIWLGTESSGIYKTTDGGNVWSATSLNQGKFQSIAINPKDNNYIYTVNGTNVIRSIDKGENWDIVFTSTTGATMTQVGIDWYSPKNIFATTNTGEILESYDTGNNWTVIYRSPKGGEISEFEISPHDSRVMLVVLPEKGFHMTTDSGKTWTDMSETLKSFPESKKIKELLISPHNRNTLYLATAYGLLKSTDLGKTWNEIKTLVPPKTAQLRNIEIDPSDPSTMYFNVNNLIHKTTDGGKSWKTIEDFPSARLILDLKIHPQENNVIYAGTYLVQEKKGIFSF